MKSLTLRSSGASLPISRWMSASSLNGGISPAISFKCGNLRAIHGIGTSHLSRGMLSHSISMGRSSVVSFLCCYCTWRGNIAQGDLLRQVRRQSNSSLISSLLRDELLCSSIIACTRWVTLGIFFECTSTSTILLHDTRPPFALHADLQRVFTVSSFLVVGGRFSL